MNVVNGTLEESFLKTVWDLYKQAEELSVANMPAKASRIITRGRSHCISGLIEDAFAILLYQQIGCECPGLRIWIDTPVSVGKVNGRVKTFYPDIIVSKALSDNEYEVFHIYELKTSTGWMREGAAKVIKKMRESLDLMADSATTKADKSETITFKVTDRTKYDLVLLTSVNNKPGKAEEIVHQARNVPGGRIGGWLLCDQELCPKHADSRKSTRETLVPRPEFTEMLREVALNESYLR